ncbi:DUF6765 family protein [Salinisphaera sp.]|uniref:DUF6765 family protein n=1 Tax=Salinisphaera sp. TaxID=1914330 RepID=UPI002D7927BD|nr:DUF6765 family protein [Salinisphaera sp.]HET7314192.1 DUF6765 family protein [Salinisphaera sp.]
MIRRPRPHPSPRRQAGIGAVEYLLGTGVLLVLLLAPFPFHGTTLNVVQRVIFAIQRQHAAYLYWASMPSLPRGPGGLSQLPGRPVGGAGGGPDAGDDLPLGYDDPGADAGESAGGDAPVGEPIDAPPGDSFGDLSSGLTDDAPPPPDRTPPNGGPGNGGPAVCATPGATPIPGAAQPTHIAATHVGNPINVITGNKFERQIDLAGLPGAHGLAFVRYYNSRTAYTGALGHNWRSNYSLNLVHTAHGIALWQADGRRIDFHFDHHNERTATDVYTAAQYGDGTLWVSDQHTRWRWRDGTDLLIDRTGVLSAIRHPDGAITRLSHDAAGRLTQVTDAQGRTLTFTYNADGRLARLADPAGAITAYRYDDRGNLAQVIGPEGRVRRYHYGDPFDAHNLTGLSRGRMPVGYRPQPLAPPEPPDNPYGLEPYTVAADDIGDAAHAHTAAYRPGATGAAGATPDTAVAPPQPTDLTRIATWAYDRHDRAVLSMHANGADQTTLAFKPHRTVVDRAGQGISIYHTATRHGVPIVTAIDGPGCAACGGADARYRYNEALQLTAQTDAAGLTTHTAYDNKGRTIAIRQTAPGGAERLIAQYLYADDSRHPAAIITPSVAPDRQHAWFLAYDDRHRLVGLAETGWTPNGDGGWRGIRRTLLDRRPEPAQPTAANPAGLAPYDPPTAYQLADGPGITRDADGRITQRIAADGAVTRLTYDAAGRLTRLVRHAESDTPLTVTLAYDAAGHLTAVTGPQGTARAAYDAAGRLTRLTGPDGATTRFHYNAAGRRVGQQHTDAAGRTITTHRRYDAQGRLIAIRRGDAPIQHVAYDAHGRLAARTNAAGVTTTDAYGAFGRIQQRTRAAGTGAAATTRYRYDARGHLIGITDARGHTATTRYNDFGEALYRATPDGGVVVYRYDAQGRRIAALDEAGRLAVRADLAAKLDADPIHAVADDPAKPSHASPAIQRTTDAAGRTTQATLPDGTTLNYAYDDQGRLTAITRDHWLFDTAVLQLHYNPNGALAARTGADGRTTEQTLDAAGRLTGQTTPDLGPRRYRYDALDRLRAQTVNGATTTYDYDPLGRLTRAAGPNGATTWAYDATGNRIQTTRNGQTTRYAIAKTSNRLQTTRSDGHAIQTTYDATGRPLTRGDMTFHYNAAGRLATVYKHQHKLAAYTYDNHGRRIEKTVYRNGQAHATRFVYAGAQLVGRGKGANGPITRAYVYQGHRPIAVIDHGTLYAVHTNRRGAPIAVAQTDGTLVWRASYTAFGKAQVNEDPDGDGQAFIFHLRLPGQYADAETGTHYNLYRTYDPATGRYQTPDPLGIADGLNAYAYVHSNPLNEIDPLGLYGIDLHYYMTYFLARMAGLDAETAQIIANATEYVDQNPQTQPCHGFLCSVPNGQSLQLYHFAMDEDAPYRGDLGTHALAARLKSKGWIDADFDYDALDSNAQAQWYESHRFLFPASPQLARLRRAALTLYPACGPRNPHAKAQLYGEYLHALEDSFAHRDNADKPYSRKQIPGMDEGYIGHGLDGHNPDKTYNHRSELPTTNIFRQWNNNEARTLAAEHAVFYKLRSDFSDVIQQNTNTTAQT